MTDLSALLACPRCDQPLDGLTCGACRVTFPSYGGLPWLFADPGAAVGHWKNRWDLALAQLEADLERVETSLARTERASTRRRLECLANGYRAQRENLRQILAPLTAAPGGSLETLLALRTRLPPAQGISSYEANVHRDWSWGHDECEAALNAVLAALADHRFERMLVLGSGAGRLAYDLHQATDAAVTVGVDLNPLLAFVAAKLSAGGTVQLVEFPLAPRGPTSAAVPRTLRAPGTARPGLEFLLADAARPPFRPGSFDAIVTPWLLDVMDSGTDTVLRRINVLLRHGGCWVHHGSVAFDAPDPAARLTPDELADVAAECGFDRIAAGEETLPYLDCPDSRHGRRESVVTLCARKARDVEPPARHEALPDWIVGGRVPIPALPAFRTQAMTTRMHAFIMTLIDGERSLKDMAGVLEAQKLMPRREAEAALRGFLIRMYDEAARGGRPAV